jgi:hypothetical protein
LIRIAVTAAAYDAIADTLPLGRVAFEAERHVQRNCLVWLDEGTVKKLGALRGPGETYSHFIIRLFRSGSTMLDRSSRTGRRHPPKLGKL